MKISNSSHTPKQWVQDAFFRFCEGNSNGYFLVLGPPGIGKTTFLQVFQENCGLPNISCSSLQEAIVKLSVLDSEISSAESFSEVFNRLHRKYPEGFLVILDEIPTAKPEEPGMNSLKLPKYLPDNFYVVIGARRSPYLFIHTLAPKEVMDIGGHESNWEDVYWTAIASGKLPENELDRMAIRLANASEGNASFANEVMEQLAKGIFPDSLSEEGKIPPNFGKTVSCFVDEAIDCRLDVEVGKAIARGAAHASILNFNGDAIEQLLDFDVDPVEVIESLKKWLPYLVVAKDKAVFYHSSLNRLLLQHR